MAVKIELPENENINEAKVVQENGKRNSALLTANVGTSGLILPEKENVDEAVYVDSDGKRHKVKMVATIYGGGSSDSHNKGWFATPTALRTAHPEAEDGDYAIVGSTDTVWVWDSDDSDWSDSGSHGAVESVNGQTGTVVLDGTDINAVVDEETDTIEGHLQSLKGGIDLISDEVDTKITNPTGGTAGQYLKKTSDGEEWADVEAGSSKVVITLTGESGTLTSEQIAQVLDDTSVLEILNGGKVFRLSNKDSTVTYRTFISSDCALSENMAFEAIYVQLNSEAANYGAWSLEEVSTGGGSGAVDSVNGKTGTVVLDAEDVGALSTTGGTVNGAVTIKTEYSALQSNILSLQCGTGSPFVVSASGLSVYRATWGTSNRYLTFNTNSISPNSDQVTLGTSDKPFGTLYTGKLNNGSDVVIPNVAGTMAVATNESSATTGMVLTKTASGAEWATGGGGSSYTAGTGIDITNSVISVTAPTLKDLSNSSQESKSVIIGKSITNNTTRSGYTIIGYNIDVPTGQGGGILIGGNMTGAYANGVYIRPSGDSSLTSKFTMGGAVIIGKNTSNTSGRTGGVIIGDNNKMQTKGAYSVILGGDGNTIEADYSVQIGGKNNTITEDNVLVFGNDNGNYKLVGSDGTIPKERLSTDTPANGEVLTYDSTNGLVWSPAGGGSGAVDSVNGQTGTVVLDADDVNAIPTAGGTLSGELTVSDGTNDCGYIYGEDGGLNIDANGDLYIGCTTGQGIIEGAFEVNGNLAKSSSSSDWSDIGDNDLVTKSEVDLVLGDLETLINAL